MATNFEMPVTGAPKRIKPGELGQRGGRIGLAVEVFHMRGKIAQLAGFIDQAGLFRTLRAITNKLHF